MAFIPHTEDDIASMLGTLGLGSVDELFNEIPQSLRITGLNNIPAALTEMQVGRLIAERGKQNHRGLCFIGAGAYEHHIPAAVWEIASRGEFYTAYTPYQAEASQGTLQLLYEFQTMIASLTGMDIANASLYDGATACAEAVLMAIRSNRKAKNRRVLILGAVNLYYQRVVNTIVKHQGIELVNLPHNPTTGQFALETLQNYRDEYAAVIIAQPNFFGSLEAIDALTDHAHQQNALVIGLVNPVALGLIREPGAWGAEGADIVCGEAQPFGVPLASGGPYVGFLTAKESFVRQMPGRIVGRTEDLAGDVGFTLTLQAREQHIRRSKAKSNICTNQGLLVTAATITMSLLGPEGLANMALACHQNANKLKDACLEIAGVECVFQGPSFHEFVLKLPQPAESVLSKMYDKQIAAGYSLEHDYPALKDCILVCATETKTNEDIATYSHTLRECLSC